MLQSMKKDAVHLLPGLFKEREEVNRNYLMELSNQALLQNFYLEAGFVLPGLQVVDDPTTANLHWGWEAPTCQLRGHFLGHYLSAAAALSAMNDDEELHAKLNVIIKELERCQKQCGGKWLAPIPEKYLGMLQKGQYVWSPQYVMHKTFVGLTDTYRFTGSKKALELVENLSDWYVEWIEKDLKDTPWVTYKGESGGMLEAWATLYGLTGKEKYKKLAESYAAPQMFKDLMDGKDALTNCHANASIPLAQGAAKMYEVTGEEKWLDIVKAFWKNAVTDRGSYCTGGQGAGEFFTPPYLEGRYLTDSNQEFCTVYNMVRLAEYLFRFTKEAQYADYIEKALYNGFLAQQNASTGMPTYFLPMKAGSKKKWGTKTRDFWCCHGTMVQAQTLYPELVYFTDGEKELYVAQYIPSEGSIAFGEKKGSIEQNVNMKYYNEQAFFDEEDKSQDSRWSVDVKIHMEEKTEFILKLRIPAWVKEEVQVSVAGKPLSKEEYRVEEGYLVLHREWKEDVITLYLPAGLSMENLPDEPDMYAVLEGPIVLAGISASDKGIVGDTGHPEDIFHRQTEHTYGVFPWKQSTYRTVNQPENMVFRPLYEVQDETYTVYFTWK